MTYGFKSRHSHHVAASLLVRRIFLQKYTASLYRLPLLFPTKATLLRGTQLRLLPCSSFFAKRFARLACSVVNLLAAARCRTNFLRYCAPQRGKKCIESCRRQGRGVFFQNRMFEKNFHIFPSQDSQYRISSFFRQHIVAFFRRMVSSKIIIPYGRFFFFAFRLFL